MDTVSILNAGSIGKNFIPDEFLPKGRDEYYYRNLQTFWPKDRWRHLRADEVEQLIKNNNSSSNWDEILVTDKFDPLLVVNNSFFGLVRIGRVENVVLEHHDLKLPAGITNSLIVACDIGDNVAIHNVGYLSHFIIGDRCIITKVDEINTSNHAKFGNGVVKEGELEEVRVWIDLMNETGCRQVMPFDGMITADAYIWAKYRDDEMLQQKLKEITQNSFDSHRGFYGMIGNQCVIKNSRILKDVKIGPHCYIKGANKLKNLTINSSDEEPTQIGEGVELVNGIIGYGCHIFYGCKAVRFILGDNSNLKYGARLINSFLGDNSTISCCEVLNNLIFPAHEQHHNNSFLIASVVLGQSNIAAGATLGSNHNSRANDNEIQAGRGFWPGLCTSVKHSCRFASFTLLSKSDYPAELNIPLPFSLLNNNVSKDQLEVMPAFWWLYNMYALARNSDKYKNRDRRKHKTQNIEYEALAPDTAEEIFNACRLLEIWTAKAWLQSNNDSAKSKKENELIKIGRDLLSGPEDKIKNLEVLGENMERSSRKVVIIKVHTAYHAYHDMLHYYAVKNLAAYLNSNPKADFAIMNKELKGDRIANWVNLGGQLIPENDADQLRSDIGSGKLKTWEEIHARYNVLWKNYHVEKQKHAYATLCELNCTSELTKEQWLLSLEKGIKIQEYISNQVYISRKKDFDNKFRQATFRNMEEMTAAIGVVDDNSFVKQVRQETKEFIELVSEIKKRN
jgi:NDP-sugar pyrophosphorylase family protein